MTKEEKYKAMNVLYELKHNLVSEKSKSQVDAVMKILCHEEEPCPYWDYESNTCRHANIGALATVDVLGKIRAEIESNMESTIGKYDSSIPKSSMPSYKIERNKVRKECISIINKYKADKE